MDSDGHRGWIAKWLSVFLGGLLIYVLSSGPMLACAFWLRERTGRDEFYFVMWLYLPLLILDPADMFRAYIEWWVKLLGTVGPG
jgi:hypothetical protein